MKLEGHVLPTPFVCMLGFLYSSNPSVGKIQIRNLGVFNAFWIILCRELNVLFQLGCCQYAARKDYLCSHLATEQQDNNLKQDCCISFFRGCLSLLPTLSLSSSFSSLNHLLGFFLTLGLFLSNTPTFFMRDI